MILLGLPLDSWVLIAASVGLGLGIELRFYRAHRRSEARRRSGSSDPTGG